MRLTRHAKNRLRFIGRRVPAISEEAVLSALGSAKVLGRDVKGNRRLALSIDDILLKVVVDDERQIVITIWREE